MTLITISTLKYLFKIKVFSLYEDTLTFLKELILWHFSFQHVDMEGGGEQLRGCGETVNGSNQYSRKS